jgi:hypothetical protein
MQFVARWFWELNSRRAIWLAPVAWALHELEELVFDIAAFGATYFLTLPPRAITGQPLWIGLAIVALNGFIWTALTAWPKNPRFAAYLTLPFFVYFSFANVLQHVYYSIYFRTYQPGVVTAVVLVAPVVVGLTMKAVGGKLIPWWYAAVLYATVVPTLIATYRAGNETLVLPWPLK